MNDKFLKPSEIDKVIKEVLTHFEFNLTSRSPLSEVIETALEKLQDNGFPQRRSLAIVIAKQAKARWVGTFNR